MEPLAPDEAVLYNADGERMALPKSDVSGALKAGFRLETEQEKKSREYETKFGDRPIAATAAAAGRGATFGLSDVALTKTGLVEPQTLEGLKEANPLASTVGEVGGAIASSFLLPGGGLVGAAGKASLAAERLAARGLGEAATSVAGRLALSGVRGTTEGALFGLAPVISETAIGDQQLTAEKLLATVGTSAAFGGGLNLLGSSLSQGIRAAPRLFASKGTSVAEAGSEAAAGAAAEATAGSSSKVSVEVGGEKRGLGFDLPGSDRQAAGALKKYAPRIQKLMQRFGFENDVTPEALVLKDLDLTGNQTKKLFSKDVDEQAARLVLNNPKYAQAKTLAQKSALVEEMANQSVETINTAASRFDAMANKGQRVDVDQVLSKWTNIAKELDDGPAGLDGAAKAVREEIEKLKGKAAGGQLSFVESERWKRGIGKLAGFDASRPDETRQAYKQLYGILNKEIEAAAEDVAIGTGKLDVFRDWKQNKEALEALIPLSQMVKDRAGAHAGGLRTFSITDKQLAGGALGSFFTPAAIPMAVGAMVANKWFRERAPHVMALALKNLEDTPEADVAATSLWNAVRDALKSSSSPAVKVSVENGASASAGAMAGAATDAAAGVMGSAPMTAAAAPSALSSQPFGPYTGLLSAAAAAGAKDLYATHAALWQGDPNYRATMAGVGIASEDNEHDGHARAQGLGSVQRTLKKHDEEVDAALDGLLKDSSSKREERDSKSYSERLEAVNQLIANPQAMAEKLAPPELLTRAAPGIATALSATAMRAVQFIHEKAPKSPYPETIPALKRPWKPSDTELAKWDRYIEAISNPAAVLKAMQRGAVTREHVEALQAVYPALTTDIQKRLTMKMSELKKPLSYKQRLTIGQLMGQSFDDTSSPATVSRIQQSLSQATASAQPRGGGRAVKPIDSRTAVQRIEER